VVVDQEDSHVGITDKDDTDTALAQLP
jgi:hypothetical protein